jgi:hypothetical protein
MRRGNPVFLLCGGQYVATSLQSYLICLFLEKMYIKVFFQVLKHVTLNIDIDLI